MTPSDITTAAADQQEYIIRACWLERNPEPDATEFNDEWADWSERQATVDTMLACGAHLSAVVMMVPARESWILDIGGDDVCAVMMRSQGVWHYAETPALALLAAIAQVEE